MNITHTFKALDSHHVTMVTRVICPVPAFAVSKATLSPRAHDGISGDGAVTQRPAEQWQRPRNPSPRIAELVADHPGNARRGTVTVAYVPPAVGGIKPERHNAFTRSPAVPETNFWTNKIEENVHC